MKKILITGANSYIGDSVRDYLSLEPDKYSVTIKDTIGWNPIPNDFKGYDVVFNVAGIAHIKETKKNRPLYYAINRDLAISIAQVAREAGVKQFILLSSMSVYGMITGHIKKNTKPNPTSAYGKSKLQADRAINKMAKESNGEFLFACLRPPMVYGKGCKGNYQTLRSFALKSPVFPDYNNQRSMIYIGNLCEFVKQIIDNEKSGLFFPQNKEYVRTSEMVREIAAVHGKIVRLVPGFRWAGNLPISIIKKVFGTLKYEGADNTDLYSFSESIIDSEKESVKDDKDKPIIIVFSSYTPSLFWYRIEMMQCFIEKGYEVYAVADQDDGEWKDKFAKIGIHYRQIFIQRNGMNPFKDLRTLREIVELYKELKPYKVFTYQAKSTIYGGIAGRIVGGIEVYPMVGGVGSVFLSDSIKTRILRLIVKIEYRIALKKSKTVFFQNIDDEDIFKKYGIIKGQRICRLAGSGVNTEHFKPMELPERTAFLLTARLIKDKGVMEYLEACEKLKKDYKEVKCLLVGPYDTNPTAITEEEIKPYIDKGIIEYFGNQEDVRPFLGLCSVFVLPSYREGTPKDVLEAMSCERAILTTDTTGCRETVDNGKNGFLVPVKDSESLYKKMKYMVENPEIVKVMAKESRKMAQEKFDVRIVNDNICKAMDIKKNVRT